MLSNHSKGVLISIVGVMAIAPDGLLVRLVDANAWTLLFWRGAVSAIFILAALSFMRWRGFVTDAHGVGWPEIAFSIIFGLGNVFFVMSLSFTSAANVLFIVASVPFFAAIIAIVFLKEPINLKTWLSIVVAFFGVGVIVSSSFEAGDGSGVGDILALGATLSMAITFCLARKFRERSMIPAMGLGGVFTALLAVPFLETVMITGWSIFFVLLMGLFLAFGYALLTLGPRYITAPEVGLILLLESVIGPYLVWLVLEEKPTIETMIGGAIIIVTLTLLNSTIFLKERRSRI